MYKPLGAWIDENKPAEDLIWKQGFLNLKNVVIIKNHNEEF